mmetsp:Transcript_21698/g.63810  ORF Transcript_21698/g.63810 Transcript_21698/m.63810 type:complete len:534 (-) Transcript_21698:455-2056(-)
MKAIEPLRFGDFGQADEQQADVGALGDGHGFVQECLVDVFRFVDALLIRVIPLRECDVVGIVVAAAAGVFLNQVADGIETGGYDLRASRSLIPGRLGEVTDDGHLFAGLLPERESLIFVLEEDYGFPRGAEGQSVVLLPAVLVGVVVSPFLGLLRYLGLFVLVLLVCLRLILPLPLRFLLTLALALALDRRRLHRPLNELHDAHAAFVELRFHQRPVLQRTLDRTIVSAEASRHLQVQSRLYSLDAIVHCPPIRHDDVRIHHRIVVLLLPAIGAVAVRAVGGATFPSGCPGAFQIRYDTFAAASASAVPRRTEPDLPPHPIPKKIDILRAERSVQAVIGAHERPRPPDSRAVLEPGAVQFSQRPRVDERVHDEAERFLIVRRDVLRARPYPAGMLNSSDEVASHMTGQVRILAQIFEVPSSARMTLQIHAGTEEQRHSQFLAFDAQCPPDVERQRSIPRTRQRARRREARGGMSLLGIPVDRLAHSVRAVGQRDRRHAESLYAPEGPQVVPRDEGEFFVERELTDDGAGGFIP